MTTRTIGRLEIGWDEDSSRYGYGDRYLYAQRVRRHFDKALETEAEVGGFTLYRQGNEIISDTDYENWSEREEMILTLAHDQAEREAEADEANRTAKEDEEKNEADRLADYRLGE